MSREAKFWNRMAKRYAKMPVPDQASYREKLTRTRAVLTPDTRVLEVGCGTGSTALAHAPYVAHILATDVAENMIKIAQAKATAEGVTNVTFRTARADEITAQEGPFDAVLALNFLHLSTDPATTLAQLARPLAPGGRLVLSTMCIADQMNWMRWIAPGITAMGVFPDLTFFHRTDLETWIADAGLDIEDTWHPKGRAKAVFHIARKADTISGLRCT